MSFTGRVTDYSKVEAGNLLDPQAAIDERVEQQESELIRLRAENEKLHDALENVSHKMGLQFTELRTQLAAAKECLEFIGDEGNYFGHDGKEPHSVADLQERARQTLSKMENK